MNTRSSQDQPQSPRPWGRRRLLASGITVALCLTALVVGIVLAVLDLTRRPGVPDDRPLLTAGEVRDRIAAAPMFAATADDALRGTPALRLPDPVRIPEPEQPRGPTGVATGFPRTPEGALAQLAAIETTVLEGMDLNLARDVHTAWVDHGGVPFEDWVLTRGVQSFLGNAGQDGSRLTAGKVTAAPAAGIVKGTDGPDWVVACVLMDVRAALRTEARVGWGHCERMAWTEGRWVITAGTPPALAPSTLPGTQAAADAGWRPWHTPGAEPVR